MDFHYEADFTLYKEDEREILSLVKEGLSVEQAIEQWQSGLDMIDCAAVDYIFNQLINYISEQLVKGDK